MDVEKAIEFILDQHAKTEVMLARLGERLNEQAAQADTRMAKTEAYLRRAIRAGVQAARNERKRRQELNEEFDKKMTQLAAAQLITEEKHQELEQSMRELSVAQRVTEQRLQSFIDSQRARGNGHP